MDLKYFLGNQTGKFKEWCDNKYGQTETINGKWIIYDTQNNPKAELPNYTEDRGARIWTNESLQNTRLMFSPSRSSIIPFWALYYLGNNLELTSENLNDSKAKSLSFKDTTTTPETNYILKWFEN